ncbi:MAG: YbjN domain-containing protein [Alphaproteobacteria bacterium]|nr:YbjN domain-containing protein [Alphaproteobacteria bacterium]MBR3502021.1 YbjN domain-containing protein [Alphaproteobacteria bacterium]
MFAENLYKPNPIDDIECVFAHRQHTVERRNANEIVVEVSGKWDTMLLFFVWEEQMNCLHISCLINLVPENINQSSIFELLALLNEDIWVGYFSFWEEMKMPVFKHSVFVDETEMNLIGKLTQVMDVALTECERAYPIFHAVLKQNIAPRKALLPMVMM